jgi:hypothetical protein
MRCAVIGALLILVAGVAHAVPVQWSVNGHWYENITTTAQSWTAAKAAAGGLSWNGLQGHLATFTSTAEWGFYATNLARGDLWLGGLQPAGSDEPGGGWQWVTGEAWGFTAWSSGEPNNVGGENALETWGTGSTWNDRPDSASLGMVVEYESNGPGGSTPEVATWALLGCTGLFGVGMLRRRRRA